MNAAVQVLIPEQRWGPADAAARSQALASLLDGFAADMGVPTPLDVVVERTSLVEEVRVVVGDRWRAAPVLRPDALQEPTAAAWALYDVVLRHRTLLAPAIAAADADSSEADVARALRYGLPLGAGTPDPPDRADRPAAAIEVAPDDPHVSASAETALPTVETALAARTGLRLPVAATTAPDVPAGTVRIRVRGLRSPPLPVPGPSESAVQLPSPLAVGSPGAPMAWFAVDADLVRMPSGHAAAFARAGATVRMAAGHLADVAARRIAELAAGLVSVDVAEQLLVELAERQPELALQGLAPAATSRVVALLRLLLEEGVRVSDVGAVAEAAADPPQAATTTTTTAALRRARLRVLPGAQLPRRMDAAAVPVTVLAPAVERRLERLADDDDLCSRIAAAAAPSRRDDVALLSVPAEVRRPLWEAVEGSAPGLAVVAHEELARSSVMVVSTVH